MNPAATLPYRHPVVRDLAWVMASPGLLHQAPHALVSDRWCQQTLSRHHYRLQALDADPTPLLEALGKGKGRRLGIYFEQLLLYWLRDLLEVDDLQHNLPIYRAREGAGRQTLGAFDFLFRFASPSPMQHWEVTVKFYLQKTLDKGTLGWVGPAGQDRLDLKLQRLFSHQLQLTQHSETQARLAALETGTLEPAAFIKGYLFYPLTPDGERDDLMQVDLSPYVLSADHLRGWWMHWGTPALPMAEEGQRWLLLSKPRWLSPAYLSETTENLLDDAALRDYGQHYFIAQQQQRPLLLAQMIHQNGAWIEYSRGFVLPPT